MDFQQSLFGDKKEEGTIAKKILIRPGPAGKNQLVNLPIENRTKTLTPRTLENTDNLPYLKEVERLLGATRNRGFLPEWLDHEKKRISEHLVTAFKKSGRPPEVIIDLAVKILENRLNLYTTQAVDFALEGDTFGLLQTLKKTIQLRR